MDFQLNHSHMPDGSPSSSTSSSSSSSRRNPNQHHHQNNGGLYRDNSENSNSGAADPMQSWWESISKARNRIHVLSNILPNSDSSSPPLSSLADSDCPARSLLSSPSAYSALASSLSSPSSGTGDDRLCQWLYETFLSSDPDLRLVVLSFIPLLSSIYLSRIHSSSTTSYSIPSLAGFEAVLLAVYASETKSRAGKPILISIPDLSQPSLYHTPRNPIPTSKSSPNSVHNNQSRPSVGVLSAPLEPQIAVKSTKRASIIGVALDCYYKQIPQMPSWSKRDFCRFAADWAGQDCPCKSEFDGEDHEAKNHSFSDNSWTQAFDGVVEEMENFGIGDNPENSVPKGVRIPLPWELLQPVLRILGHCLLAPLNSDDVRDAASVAVRCLYARASHDLVPQAILATRSLIQLDKRARDAAKATAVANAASNSHTPSKARKPEILLVSK